MLDCLHNNVFNFYPFNQRTHPVKLIYKKEVAPGLRRGRGRKRWCTFYVPFVPAFCTPFAGTFYFFRFVQYKFLWKLLLIMSVLSFDTVNCMHDSVFTLKENCILNFFYLYNLLAIILHFLMPIFFCNSFVLAQNIPYPGFITSKQIIKSLIAILF